MKRKRGRARGSPAKPAERKPRPDIVPTAQAAEELQMTPPTVRYLMEVGQLPIGDWYRRQERGVYIIYRGLLDKEKARRGLM